MKRLNQVPDNVLIHQFLEGNESSLEELINRYKDKIYTSILFLVRDKYLAEDLFQDSFIKILDTIKSGRYNEEGKFLPWATRIARNLCIDYFRKEKSKHTVVISDPADMYNLGYPNEETAERRIIKGEETEQMFRMIDKLPPEQREVIILRHFGEMSFKEIAATMNCSLNTALGRMRYGLINLRKMMAPKQVACK